MKLALFIGLSLLASALIPARATAEPGLESLPFDPLVLIARHLETQTDFRNLALVSKTIYNSLTEGDEEIRRRKARVRSQIADLLNPRQRTLNGAVFTRRTDLEWRFREHVTGEIWQEPSQNGFPGLIWFPSPIENRKFVKRTFLEAADYCVDLGRVLGIPLREPLSREWSQLVDWMRDPESQLYKPQILKNIQGVFWTGSSRNASEGFAAAFNAKKGHGGLVFYHVLRSFRVRCVLQPGLILTPVQPAEIQPEGRDEGLEPRLKRRRASRDVFDPPMPLRDDVSADSLSLTPTELVDDFE